MSQLEKDIERLKDCLNPEREKINIIEQCRIVYDALRNKDSQYYRNTQGFIELLDVSENKVSKMMIIHRKMHPQLKEWFSGTDYQMNTAYMVGRMSHKAQLEWLHNVEILEGKHT